MCDVYIMGSKFCANMFLAHEGYAFMNPDNRNAEYYLSVELETLQ